MNYTDTKSSLPGLIGVIAAACLLTAVPMEGANLIFDQINNDGTLSYDGLGGALVGTDIVFESIRGVGTDNDTTIDCDGCLLNFRTGSNIGDVGGVYTFSHFGSSFTLVGGSILGGIPGGTTLLEGRFTRTVNVTVFGESVLIMTGSGEDEKDPDLIDFFFDGAPENFIFVDSVIQISGITVGPGTAFSADLAEGGNADLINSVPAPGTTALFLLGLSGLAAYRRRRN